MSETMPNVGDEQEAQPSQALEPAQRGMPAETAAIVVTAHGLAPGNFSEQWRVAQAAVQSGLIPVKKTAEAWLIMQRGAELGFPLITAIEFLYPVDGRLRLSPDGAKAIALASDLLEDFKEYEEGVVTTGAKGLEFSDDFKAVCWIKRRGIPTPIVRTFSVADAKTARLWPGFERGSKAKNNWESYPKRMLAARARGFGFQDAFRDRTGGLQVRERFDLDHGERIGGVTVAPPDARDITPQRSAPAGRHPVLAQLVGAAQPVEAQAQPRPEALQGATQPQEAPVEREWSAAEAQAAILAEAARRTDGDPVAAQDLAREVTGGIAKVKTREAAVEAHAKLAAHPRFGDAS